MIKLEAEGWTGKQQIESHLKNEMKDVCLGKRETLETKLSHSQFNTVPDNLNEVSKTHLRIESLFKNVNNLLKLPFSEQNQTSIISELAKVERGESSEVFEKTDEIDELLEKHESEFKPFLGIQNSESLEQLYKMTEYPFLHLKKNS